MADKTPAEKLLIKPGQKLLFVHPPQGLAALLGPLPPGAQAVESSAEPLDFILVFADSRQGLESDLPRLKDALSPGGNIWVAYHKGTSGVKTDINRDIIRDYVTSIGLETIALISIDEDWSAMRLKRSG
jgi:hypothetical protein